MRSDSVKSRYTAGISEGMVYLIMHPNPERYRKKSDQMTASLNQNQQRPDQSVKRCSGSVKSQHHLLTFDAGLEKNMRI